MKTNSALIQALLAGTALTMLAGAPSYAADTPAAGAATTLPEIIVTAQRRSERLQDVPISVTSANAKALAENRVFNIENISSLSPSISFSSANLPSSGANIQIRGIGTTGTSRSFESSVGVFVDGVYRTRAGQALNDFLDIDNLQILRGPQGTLFGKNTSAGTVLLTSTAPSTSGILGNYEVGYGNYNEYRVKGSINIPLSDQVAVRLSALQTDHDGYVKNVNGGTDNRMRDDAAKLQLLYQPNDTFKLRFIGDYAVSQGNCCFGTVEVKQGPVAPLVNFLTLLSGKNLPSTNPQDYQASTTPTPTHVEDFGGTILADAKLGTGTLHSVTAVRKYGVEQTEDATFSGADILDPYETFNSRFISQELTYNGQVTGAVNADYVLGAYFSDEHINIDRTASYGPMGAPFFDTLLGSFGIPSALIYAAPGNFYSVTMNENARSYAVFTHWDFKFGDKWNLIVGLRGTQDHKAGGLVENKYIDPYPYNPLPGPGYNPNPQNGLAWLGDVPIPYQASTTSTALSGTLGVQYHINHDAMLYATYNRGYKAGGVNLDDQAAGLLPISIINGYQAIKANPVYNPEITDAYEGGVKIDWFDHRARTNASIFYDNIYNLQVAQFVGLTFTVQNAPSAKVYGAEFEQAFKITPELTLTAAGTYLPEAKFGKSASLGAPLSGRTFGTAPTFAGQIALFGQHPVSADLALTGRLQVQYTTRVFTNTADDETQDGYALVNANFGLTSLSKHWTLEAWGENLTDVRYITQHFQTPVQSGSTGGFVGAPRTYGFTLRGSF